MVKRHTAKGRSVWPKVNEREKGDKDEVGEVTGAREPGALHALGRNENFNYSKMR